ncbi:hypothetical protein GCM10027419_27440 [Pandoraea terrae]
MLIYVISVTILLLGAASIRELYLLPLYPAFALIAARLASIPIRSAGKRLGLAVSIGVVGGYGWLQWGLLVWAPEHVLPWGVSAWLPVNDFSLPFQPFAFAVAILVTGLWGWILFRGRSMSRAWVWLANVTLIWGILHTLLLPWLDAARGYRVTFVSLREALPSDVACLDTIGVGESERAMLHYWVGVVPTIANGAGPSEPTCSHLLIMDKHGRDREAPPFVSGNPLWQGSRQADRNERFRLFETVRLKPRL